MKSVVNKSSNQHCALIKHLLLRVYRFLFQAKQLSLLFSSCSLAQVALISKITCGVWLGPNTETSMAHGCAEIKIEIEDMELGRAEDDNIPQLHEGMFLFRTESADKK